MSGEGVFVVWCKKEQDVGFGRRAMDAVLNEGDWNPVLLAGRACQCVCE